MSMGARETAVLLVLCILHHTTDSSTYRDSGHKGNEKTTAITRNVTGTGFHRHFTCQIDFLPVSGTDGCHLAVQLQVPREMYFDIDQISMLNNDERIAVYSRQPVSTELPVDAVEESAVWLFAGVEAERFEVKLPIHMRYQPPCELGHTSIHSLPEPQQVLVNCESSHTFLQSTAGAVLLAGIDACVTDLPQASVQCLWREVSFTLSDSHLEWEGRVPCGVTHVTPYVTLTTVLLTLLCAGYILHALVAVSKEQTNKDRTRELASKH